MERRTANKRILRGVGIALFWLAVWEIAALLVNNAFFLPSPVETAARFFALAATAEFWRSAGMTLLRIALGFLLAAAGGVLLAALSEAVPFADALLRPIRGIIKATPVTSFILLVVLWLESGIVPVFIAFLMVLPLIWTNVQEGIRATDKQLLEMARLFRFGRWRTLRLVYAPSVMPQFMAACATGIGFAWKAGVTAEVLAVSAHSIGRNLYKSKLYLETPDLFAWTVLVVLLSILLERAVLLILRRFGARWKGGEQ